jgi:hypothetical protein
MKRLQHHGGLVLGLICALLVGFLGWTSGAGSAVPTLGEPTAAVALYERQLQEKLDGYTGQDAAPEIAQGQAEREEDRNDQLALIIFSEGFSACIGSACAGSACIGSACAASACGGSACEGSGCAGSVCEGSACVGSLCGGSGCAGSACGGSACGASACVLSVCVESGCLGSGCAGSACGGSGCGGSACAGSGCNGSACVFSGCYGSACAASGCDGCSASREGDSKLAAARALSPGRIVGFDARPGADGIETSFIATGAAWESYELYRLEADGQVLVARGPALSDTLLRVTDAAGDASSAYSLEMRDGASRVAGLSYSPDGAGSGVFGGDAICPL